MERIVIEVIGNIARVLERPTRITSGTVGIPVEFIFDEQWDELNKMAVFRAGNVVKAVYDPGEDTVVPWEVLATPKLWLRIGVCGVDNDGTEAIPTIWANVSKIHVGTAPDGDPSTDPTLPIWQDMMNHIKEMAVKPSAITVDVYLPADAWVGSGGRYTQVLDIEGITKMSMVDLQLSVEQMEIFREQEISFSTENVDGVLNVYVVGDKPTEDYTFQATITEVVV